MKFIVHRGFWLHFAENSLPAFQAVIEHPCNGRSLIGIELDLMTMPCMAIQLKYFYERAHIFLDT